MFLDRVKIWVRAGDGGDGAATFRQEAHVPRGGPDGGDGGRGGSVYLKVDAGQTTLRDFGFKHHFKATPGGRGSKARRHGKAGTDLYLEIPPGTAIYDDDTGELIGDLVAVGQETMVARGGRGGLGNTHFKTSTHQAPKHAQKGEPGSEHWLRLELRLIADIGLVGLPNAGKSTLLAALTAATPKIADYPFTTLEPNLGVMDLGDEDERRPTIADVPGLIEGASDGAGLGHAFLRHVERTRILVHVVDGSGRDPGWDFDVIREELRAHDPALLDKPMLVAFNKLDQAAAAGGVADVPTGPRAGRACGGRHLSDRRRGSGRLPGPHRRDAARRRGPRRTARTVRCRRPPDLGHGRRIPRRTRGGRRVPGPRRSDRTDRSQTNFDVEESAERFQRDLASLGMDAELRRAGIETGDLVRIAGAELEWGPRPMGGAVTGGRRGPAAGSPGHPRRDVRSRSTSHTWRSPRRRARPSASIGSCSSRPGIPPHKPTRPSRLGTSGSR